MRANLYAGATPSTASTVIKIGEVGPLSIKVDGLTGGSLQVQYSYDNSTFTSYASADSLFSADGEVVLTDGNCFIRLNPSSATGTVRATISGPGVIGAV